MFSLFLWHKIGESMKSIVKSTKVSMKSFLLIIMLTMSLSMSATSKDTLNAVTMVAYEQGWIDDRGTLSLKNNTNEDIHNVAYRITYFDMKGNALDYEDFTSDVEIAPGMTKKVSITAYEHNRQYSYYRSEASPMSARRFKIKFQLTGYNTSEEELAATQSYTGDSTSTGSHNDPWFELGLFFLAIILIIGFYIGTYVLVAVMAKKRNRNAALWILVALFATPLISIVVLLCIGRSNYPYEDID